MRLLLAIALLAAAPDTTPRVRGRELGEGTRVRDQLDQRPVAPLFSFAVPAPGYKGYAASYAGLPATDGCYPAASVTGTKGEALTFTRATTRFCPTSANEATGVMCASGEVCITSSGTTRGISIFRAGTNLVLRSEEFDNAAWTKEAGGKNPTVTADHALGPDGVMGAERVQLQATGTNEYSDFYQLYSAGTGSATTCSLWVKGNGTSGTTDLCIYDGGAAWACTPVAFTPTWKLFSLSDAAGTGTSRGVKFGNASGQNGGTARDAADVHATGFMCSESPYATPYVATTSASATRNAELVTFPIAWDGGNLISTAFTSVTRGASALIASQGGLALNSSFPSGGPAFLSYYTSGAVWRTFTTATDRAAVAPADAASVRVANGCDGTNSFSIWGGASTTNGTNCDAIPNTSDTLAVGWFTTNTQLDGLISSVCIDPSSTRCR